AIFTQGAFSGDRQAYVAAAFKSISGQGQTIPVGTVRETTVNGIPAFYTTATVNTQQGARELTVFAYEWGGNVGYHFITISAPGASPFGAMLNSMTRLSNAQAASIKPRKLRTLTVGKGDTVATMVAKMAYESLQKERFLALNGISANSALVSGQKVKIVTY
ncbi:MAG: peptidase M48 Ste24p, partial [Sphingorhabdus sp.]